MRDAVKLRGRFQNELRVLLRRKHWTHHVTLAFNDVGISDQRARERLREWDARTNRKLVGHAWHKRPDERMCWVAFIEHPDTNAHWHLLLELPPSQEEDLLIYAPRLWKTLVPSGSLDVRPVSSQASIIRYVTKDVTRTEQWEGFMTSLELIRY